MKRLFAFALAALLVMPAASAREIEPDYTISPWAREDVKEALALGIPHDYYGSTDLRKPIPRRDFAEKAASLVAIEFSSNLKSYALITSYRREEAQGGPTARLSELQVAKDLGILQGRSEEDWDLYSSITRQEAAVMLARTYRAYQDTMPDTMQPLTFTDQGAIADWALEDVQLMNHLGVMNGVENNRFDPLGSYTFEQCFLTLLRLHEKAPYDGAKRENPFAIEKREGGFVKIFENSDFIFAIETEDYYIIYALSYRGEASMGSPRYSIHIIDQEFSLRSYPPAVLESSSPRGDNHAKPENPSISEDGTKLIYTATVPEDAYRYNMDGGIQDPKPLFLKGLYTVTMDLKTGEQTWTRADLS